MVQTRAGWTGENLCCSFKEKFSSFKTGESAEVKHHLSQLPSWQFSALLEMHNKNPASCAVIGPRSGLCEGLESSLIYADRHMRRKLTGQDRSILPCKTIGVILSTVFFNEKCKSFFKFTPVKKLDVEAIEKVCYVFGPENNYYKFQWSSFIWEARISPLSRTKKYIYLSGYIKDNMKCFIANGTFPLH